jgi:Rieske Fe-S protein
MAEEETGPTAEPQEGEGIAEAPPEGVVRGGGTASRRKFIQFGLGVVGLSVAGEVGWILLKGLEPGAEAAPQPVEVEVGDIPDGDTKEFLYGSDPHIIIRSEEEYTVLSLVCTHLGCIVKWGDEEQSFHCPCHAAGFDKNGRVTSGPPPAPLEKPPFKLTGDKMVVGE